MSTDDFFKLPGDPPKIDADAFFALTEKGGEIRSRIYSPASLKSPEHPQHWKISNCDFVEVSFAKTFIEGFEFENCSFSSCLFMGCLFKDCRFTDCSFISCNTHRIEFSDVYVNPRAFDRCLDKNRHQNLGVHLYQELLNNSRRQSQPDFTNDAFFRFRLWLRFENFYKLKQENLTAFDKGTLWWQIATNYMNEKCLGFGVRLRNYIRTAAAIAILFSLINYVYMAEFGLKIRSHAPGSLVDAFYFTVITLTTVGYGDIAPETTSGRLIVSAEAISGFVLFAILASMIYRKILP